MSVVSDTDSAAAVCNSLHDNIFRDSNNNKIIKRNMLNRLIIAVLWLALDRACLALCNLRQNDTIIIIHLHYLRDGPRVSAWPCVNGNYGFSAERGHF